MKRILLLACLLAAIPVQASPDETSPALAVRIRQATVELEKLRGNLDPGAHAQAANAVRDLARAAPGHPRVIALQAWLAMNAHRFADALVLADAALARAPREPVALALRTDALTELGRYPEAIEAAEALDAVGAGAPAWLRIAHLRRLHGDIDGAIELATRVVEQSSPSAPDRAWLLRELAALHWHAGRDAAALAILQSVPAEDRETLVLSARILESEGRIEEAHANWMRAAEAAPLPGSLVGQWRLASAADERRRLAHQLEGMARLDEAQGGLSRRDFIEFYARSGKLAEARRLATLEYQRRPDVFSAAQLAWVLARADEPDAANLRAREAMRLGTVDRDIAAELAFATESRAAAQ